MSIKWNLKRKRGVSLGKIVPVQTMKKLGRGIAPLIPNLTAKRSCQLHAPTAAPPGVKSAVPIGYHAGWTSEQVWKLRRADKFLASANRVVGENEGVSNVTPIGHCVTSDTYWPWLC